MGEQLNKDTLSTSNQKLLQILQALGGVNDFTTTLQPTQLEILAAILAAIMAGGGGGGGGPLQNLQQITNIGNATTNEIIVETLQNSSSLFSNTKLNAAFISFFKGKLGSPSSITSLLKIHDLSIPIETSTTCYLPLSNEKTLVTSINNVFANENGEVNIPSSNNTQTGAVSFNTSDGATSWKILSLPIVDENSLPVPSIHYCTGFVDLKASVLCLDPNLKQEFFLFFERLAFVYNPLKNSELVYNLGNLMSPYEEQLSVLNYNRQYLDNVYVFSAKLEDNNINIYVEKTQYAIDYNIANTEAIFNVQYSYSFIKNSFVSGGNGGGGGGGEQKSKTVIELENFPL